MYRQRLPRPYVQRSPYRYVQRRPYTQRRPYVIPFRPRLSPKETLWRLSWPYVFTLILASLMLLFIIIIFILEIASLAIDNSNNLSNTASTGAGIWCSLFFIIPVVFMYLLVLVFDSSRNWSTYTLIAHMIALVFICILVALDANTVTPYNTMLSTAPTKIKILKGQLAMAILMFSFPLTFFAAYIYTAFKALFPFRSHNNSVYPPFPNPLKLMKY